MTPLPPRRPSQYQRGLSLIELMVSLTLGMMIVSTIGYVYVGASRTFRTMEAASRMQENARYAMERISYDLRMAGYMGCYTSRFVNVLNSPTSWQYNLNGFPILGYEDGVSTFPSAITTRLRGDALTIVRADNSEEYVVESHNPSSATLSLTATHDIKEGEVLVITDCSDTAMFQMSNTNNNNTIDNVNHNTGNDNPGNFTKGLGIPTGASNPHIPAASCASNPSLTYCKGSNKTNGASKEFAAGSRLYRIDASTYFIGYRGTNTNSPGLYREKLSHQSGDAVLEAEEIVDGVENMQITYGVDTSGTADKTVDVYAAADQVASASPETSLEADWKRVLSVRISLLMVSGEGENTTNKPQTYTFNGETVETNDYRLRKVFNTTIAVRNRL